jgi:transcription initiation factor TFIID subunit 12
MNSNDRNILSKSKLQEIVNQIDPRHTLDPEVEEILLEIADDFIENITHMGCTLAKHRGSNILEVKDIQLNLDKNWNIKVPGRKNMNSPWW